MGLSTYGLVLVRLDGEEDPEAPKLVRIKMRPMFNQFVIRPIEDEERKAEIRRLIRVQLACFSVQLLAGIGQARQFEPE